jgi:MerR family mercuric resistance operon transcriptional regulator
VRTSQVAAAAGVNRQTLRYYERRGLLAEPTRTLGGHRQYPAEAVDTLRLIKAAQRLGFTLDEVAGLLSTDRRHAGAGRRRPGGGGMRPRAEAKLAEVEARIAELTAVAGTLRAALDAGCDDLATCAATPACPLPFAEGGPAPGSAPAPATSAERRSPRG